MLAAKLWRDLWNGLMQAAGDRARVKATVRRGIWQPAPGQPGRDCYFIALRSLADVEVLVTQVWFETEPRAFVDRRQRRLPKALAAGETWETWFEVDRLPETAREQASGLARVRLASGTVLKAKPVARPRINGERSLR
jgi:hypothetical protein